MKSDGTNRTEFAPAAILGSPVGLALDWMSQNLYYTNPSSQSIEVLHLTALHYFFYLKNILFCQNCESYFTCTMCVYLGSEAKRRGTVQENSHCQ